MREQQHIHGKIGDAIYECKKRLFNQLKAGTDLDTALAQFIRELQEALTEIASKT